MCRLSDGAYTQFTVLIELKWILLYNCRENLIFLQEVQVIRSESYPFILTNPRWKLSIYFNRAKIKFQSLFRRKNDGKCLSQTFAREW